MPRHPLVIVAIACLVLVGPACGSDTDTASTSPSTTASTTSSAGDETTTTSAVGTSDGADPNSPTTGGAAGRDGSTDPELIATVDQARQVMATSDDPCELAASFEVARTNDVTTVDETKAAVAFIVATMHRAADYARQTGDDAGGGAIDSYIVDIEAAAEANGYDPASMAALDEIDSSAANVALGAFFGFIDSCDDQITTTTDG